jgi:hypothetical protein
MATVNWGGANAAQPYEGRDRHFILRSRIDGSSTTCASADTNKAAIIKAGWFIKRVWVKEKTAGSQAVNFGVGDSTSTGIWNGGQTFAASTVKTLPTDSLLNGIGSAEGGPTGKYYSSADYLHFANVMKYDGVCDIFAEVIDMSAREDAADYTN